MKVKRPATRVANGVKPTGNRDGEKVLPMIGQGSSRFPDRMPMGQFLFAYLHRRGVKHCFGVPGDFALPTFAWLEKSEIQNITMTHEPSAGFAADAYSRVNGIGLVAVTYCVGGLNVLNAIAGAYAEKSPVVVVSGAPGREDRKKDPLLHHKVKTFETQRRVYDEVTVASAVLLDEERAAAEIVRCVEACLHHKRPVYIEVPHDMVDREIPTMQMPVAVKLESDPKTLAAALDETMEMLRSAKKPVILAGVELHRFGLTDGVIRMAEAMNIPIAADLLSKSAVAENHPLYLGVYGGAMSSDEFVRDYVESSDCVLMLGTFITDMNMGIYTAKLDAAKSVLATTESIKMRYHRYDDVQFADYLNELEARATGGMPSSVLDRSKSTGGPAARGAHSSSAGIARKKFTHPHPHAEPKPLAKSELQEMLHMADVFRIVSLHLDEHCCVVSDVGDAIFGAVGIRTARRAEFIAPAYYLSMGFAVPASIGVAMGNPALRPVVLVGDGAFQMTGTELSTAVRLGLNPIILILNNDGYGTMRKIRDGSFNVISRWNYGKICELVGGGETSVAETKGQLDGAIRAALGSRHVHVIDVRIPRDDMSPQLANMSAELGRARGMKQ